MRQRVVYFAMILAAVTSVSAQEAKKWTLDDCIDYALEKNIQLLKPLLWLLRHPFPYR